MKDKPTKDQVVAGEFTLGFGPYPLLLIKDYNKPLMITYLKWLKDTPHMWTRLPKSKQKGINRVILKSES